MFNFESDGYQRSRPRRLRFHGSTTGANFSHRAEQLYNLNALDEEGLLTRLGRKMASSARAPMSKMLIASVDLGCAGNSHHCRHAFRAEHFLPSEREARSADQKRAKFFQPEGDHLALLTGNLRSMEADNFSSPWCFENYLQARSLRRAQDVRKQLLTIMDRYRLEVTSAGRNRIRRAITSGFFFHAAKKDPQESFKTLVENTPTYIHPSSSLFQRQPDWVVYHELVLTSKEYMNASPSTRNGSSNSLRVFQVSRRSSPE